MVRNKCFAGEAACDDAEGCVGSSTLVRELCLPWVYPWVDEVRSLPLMVCEKLVGPRSGVPLTTVGGLEGSLIRTMTGSSLVWGGSGPSEPSGKSNCCGEEGDTEARPFGYG